MILSLTCTPHIVFGEQTGFQVLTQRRPDISEYASFHFYSWVWHWDQANGMKQLGKWLGVAEGVGPVMTFWVLPITCVPIPRSSVVSVQSHEMDLPQVKELMTSFTASITNKCRPNNFLVDKNLPFDTHNSHADTIRSLGESHSAPPTWDGDHRYLPFEPTSEESAMEKLDEYIGAQIKLNTPKGSALVKVISRHRDPSGQLIGTRHDIPQLDSRIYNVKFEDGHYEQYSTNILAEALASEFDNDGFDTGFISEISGYRQHSTSVPRSKGFFLSKCGNRNPVVTTKGWDHRITWKDGSSTWVPLSYLKNAEPLLVAKYAKTIGIQDEPAYKWWVPHTLREQSRLISKLKTAYHKNNLQYGLEVPKNYADAIKLDLRNGNTYWAQAIEKEMTNVKVAFKFLGKGIPPPVGYKGIKCFIIFSVRMDLTRKARFVAGGHMTAPPTSMTYASVVSRESVRIAFLLAAANDLDMLSGDIGNAYLNAFITEKIYYRAGPEWGPAIQGTVCVIVRVLYGLKTSAKRFHEVLSDVLREMGFVPCPAEPDIWMRAMNKDGTSSLHFFLNAQLQGRDRAFLLCCTV